MEVIRASNYYTKGILHTLIKCEFFFMPLGWNVKKQQCFLTVLKERLFYVGDILVKIIYKRL